MAEQTMFQDYLFMIFQFITSVLAERVELLLLVGVPVLFVTTLLCCCYKRSSYKKPMLYGKIREVSGHVGGKKKLLTIDPFMYSHVEFQRKFADELARLLYCLGTEVATPFIESDHFIRFTDVEGRECPRQYSTDYRWLLKHFSVNARRYAFLLTGTTNPQLQEVITRCKNILPLEELVQRVQDECRPYSDEVVKSFERYMYENVKN